MEDEMVGSRHWFNGHELGQTPGNGEGQGGLASCSPWCLTWKESQSDILRMKNLELHKPKTWILPLCIFEEFMELLPNFTVDNTSFEIRHFCLCHLLHETLHSSFSFFSFILVLFIYFTILYWFCHTLTWICHGCTCVLHPETPPTSCQWE